MKQSKIDELIQKHRDNKAPVISYSELESIVREVANLVWDKCEVTNAINIQDTKKVKKQFINQLFKEV